MESTWTILSLNSLLSAGGATLNVLGDNSVLVSGTNPVFDAYTFSAITGRADNLRLYLLSFESSEVNGKA